MPVRPARRTKNLAEWPDSSKNPANTLDGDDVQSGGPGIELLAAKNEAWVGRALGLPGRQIAGGLARPPHEASKVSSAAACSIRSLSENGQGAEKPHLPLGDA